MAVLRVDYWLAVRRWAPQANGRAARAELNDGQVGAPQLCDRSPTRQLASTATHANSNELPFECVLLSRRVASRLVGGGCLSSWRLLLAQSRQSECLFFGAACVCCFQRTLLIEFGSAGYEFKFAAKSRQVAAT